MDAGTTAQTLPLWAGYLIAGLSAVGGIFLVFVLGLVSSAVQKRANPQDIERRDCANCPSVHRVEEGLNSLNQRIDRILELRGS